MKLRLEEEKPVSFVPILMTSGNYLPPSGEIKGDIMGEVEGEETGVLIVVGWFREAKHLGATWGDGSRDTK